MYPLRGVRLKLARARSHLEALKDAYDAFCDREPFTVSMRYEDREHTEQAVFHWHVQERPPTAWSVIIGDCLQNARAALEHLAWELSCPEYGGSEPNTDTAFPIYRRRRDYMRMKDGPRSKVRAMAEPAQKVIEGLQPYRLEAEAHRDPLWILNELARVDRHQVLHVVVAVVTGETVWTMPSDTPGGGAYLGPADITDEIYERISQRGLQPDTPEDGTEMASVMARMLPQGKPRTVGFEAGYFIVFSESEARITTGLPIIETLERILRHIETEIVPRFGKFF